MSNKKLNITEIIESYEGKPLPDIFKKLNFKEIGEKHINETHDKRLIQFSINESISENIMKNLPFNIYKELITMEWLTSYKNNKPINVCLESKAFDTIEWALNNIPKDDFHKYNQAILTPILSWPKDANMKSLNYNLNDMNRFISIWEKTIDLVQSLDPFAKFRPEWIIRPQDPLLVKYEKVTSRIMYDSSSYILLKKLVGNSVSFPLFEKLTKDLTSKNLLDIKEDDMSLAEVALTHGNQKAVNFFTKRKLITSVDYKNSLVNVSDYLLSRQGRKEKNHKDLMKEELWITKLCLDNLSNQDMHSIPAHQLIGLLLGFKDNEVIFDKLINFPQLKTQNLLAEENTSLSELNFLIKISKHLNKKLDMDEEKHLFNFLPILNSVLNMKDSESMTNLKEFMDNSLVKKFIIKLNPDAEKAKTIFMESALELTLKQNPSGKKIKI